MTRREFHREMVRAQNRQLRERGETVVFWLVFGPAYLGALFVLALFAEALFA